MKTIYKQIKTHTIVQTFVFYKNKIMFVVRITLFLPTLLGGDEKYFDLFLL